MAIDILEWSETDNQGDLSKMVINMGTNEEVGHLLKYYLVESEHNNWEGYTAEQVTVIKEFIIDLDRSARFA